MSRQRRGAATLAPCVVAAVATFLVGGGPETAWMVGITRH
jgi:hypothetical protein